MYMCAHERGFLWRPEALDLPEAGVIDSYEPLTVGDGTKLGS